MILPFLLSIAASQCTAIDGDTIKCRGQRYRLLGIDAPELHGCRKGRKCVAGNARKLQRQLVGNLIDAVFVLPARRAKLCRQTAAMGGHVPKRTKVTQSLPAPIADGSVKEGMNGG